MKILHRLLTAIQGSGRKSNLSQKSRRHPLTLETLEDRALMSVSPQEQLFVYDLNRARANPATYQQETQMPVNLSSVAPQQPLAVNDKLFASAEYHAADMAAHNYFSHQTPSGLWPNKMARNAGYALPSWWSDSANYIESIAAGFPTAPSALYALIQDYGIADVGHRVHLLGMNSFFADHKEIGVGYVQNTSAAYQNYWAIHTAYVNTTDVFLTGVVYNDLNGNNRYDLNEGLSGVTVLVGSWSTTTNAAGGWSLQVAGGTSYQVTVSGGAFVGATSLNVNVGTKNVEVDFLSGRANGFVNFVATSGGPVNLAPTLDPIAHQIGNRGNQIVVNLSAIDPEGASVTYSAQVYSLAQGLDLQLGLTSSTYATNLHGAKEKYFKGTGNLTYFILPTGGFYKWTGSIAGSTLIAQFDASCYADPTRLWKAAATTVDVTAEVSGNQLTLTPGSNFTGCFMVQVAASDGQTQSSTWFKSTVINHAPVLTPVADQSLTTNGGPVAINLSASDEDGDAVTFSARAVSQAYALDQQLGLNYTGNYYLNLRGAKEKYLRGTAGVYFLLPTGALYKYTDSIAHSTLVAQLGTAFYADPSKLWKALPGTIPVTVSVTGNQLTIDPSGYVGSFVVQLGAGDGLVQTTGWVNVTVVNHAPDLQPIPDQTVSSGAVGAPTSDSAIVLPAITINLNVSDADGDNLALSAGAVSKAYALDQQLGLSSTGNYYINLRGAKEKYLRGCAGTYFLLPSGDLYKWTGTIAGSSFIASLGSTYYANPALLWNATPGTIPVSVTLTGNQLTIDPTGFLGSFVIEVSACDGLATTVRRFLVTSV